MASKSNPIRLRLNLQKFNHFTFSKNSLFSIWTNKTDWLDFLNFQKEVSVYNQKQWHIKQTWDSIIRQNPKTLFYQNGLILKLFLKKFIELSFFHIGFFVFQTHFIFKKTELVIQIHTYPFKKLTNYQLIIQNIASNIASFSQRYAFLKCKILIFDHFMLLNQYHESLNARSDQASSYHLINVNKNFEKQQFIFQSINAFFLIKSAKLLAKILTFELEQSKKQHLVCLHLIQKSLERFWILNQIPRNVYSNETSSFRKQLLGVRIEVKGRLNGQDRKQKFSFSIGRLALQELATNVDFFQDESFGLSGVFGIKVWVSFKLANQTFAKKLKSTFQNQSKNQFQKKKSIFLFLEP